MSIVPLLPAISSIKSIPPPRGSVTRRPKTPFVELAFAVAMPSVLRLKSRACSPQATHGSPRLLVLTTTRLAV
jgi:hypothetical protein